MGTRRRWNGSVFKTGGTPKRWNGSVFKTGGTPRRWTGSGWQPPVAPAFGFIGAASTYATTTNPTLTVPFGVVATDTVYIGIASANNAATIALTGSSNMAGPTDTGSMQGQVITATGFKAGDTLTLTTNASINPSAIAAVWYRGASSVGGMATPAAKVGTVTTLVAPDVTDDTTGDLIVAIFMEKSGSNVALGAPAVAGITNRAWVPWANSAAGLPSVWIGDYPAPAAAKTITYPQSSANGLAVQFRLRP